MTTMRMATIMANDDNNDNQNKDDNNMNDNDNLFFDATTNLG